MNRATKLCLLAIVFVVCGSAALMRHHREQDLHSAPPSVLYDVVRQQIDAFRTDDYPTAYRQVSNGFQERCNIEAFADLARTEYLGMTQVKRVEFGAVKYGGTHALVPVYFFLGEGEVIPCLYTLVYEDGTWKIDGTRLFKRWPAGRRLGGLRA